MFVTLLSPSPSVLRIGPPLAPTALLLGAQLTGHLGVADSLGPGKLTALIGVKITMMLLLGREPHAGENQDVSAAWFPIVPDDVTL